MIYYCPQCKCPMVRNGSQLGRTRATLTVRYQQFRCANCGAATLMPLDEAGNRIEKVRK